jgi:hypothetical protein
MALTYDDVYDAIAMFRVSPTGRGRKGLHDYPSYIAARYTLMAARSVNALLKKYEEDEIGFVSLPEGILGRSRSGWASWGRHDIQVARQLRDTDDLGSTSVVLAHEGAHVDNKWQPLDQEVMTRTLEVLYYQDFVDGTVWARRKKTGKMQRFGVTDIKSKKLRDELRHHSSLFREKHLIDAVVENYKKLVSAEWIKRSIRWWGGISTRFPESRGLYIRKLIGDGGVGPTARDIILSLLEASKKQRSLELTASSSPKLDEIRKIFARGADARQVKRWKALEPALKGKGYEWGGGFDAGD